jgi:hypothetical protein
VQVEEEAVAIRAAPPFAKNVCSRVIGLINAKMKGHTLAERMYVLLKWLKNTLKLLK